MKRKRKITRNSNVLRDYANKHKHFNNTQKPKIVNILLFVFGLCASVIPFIYYINSASPPSKKVKNIQLPDNSHVQNTFKPINSMEPYNPNIQTLSEAVANDDPEAWQKVVIKSGDNLATIFNKLGLKSQQLQSIVNTSKLTKQLKHLHPKQELLFNITPDKNINQLIYNLNLTDSLVITQENQKYKAKVVKKNLETIIQFAKGSIQNSLFFDGQTAGLDDKLIMELAYIFGWDIDFALDIRPGDTFKVLYEENFLTGKKVSNGDIIAAEFINQGRKFQAIRFTNSQGQTDYYAPDGTSMRKAFIRTPVNFTRISSKFRPSRKHPILHRIRAHKGVDYAAPRGTPVKAAGDGKVIFKGRKGGYGNAIIIQHSPKYSTLYAHLNSFNRKVRIWGRVKQGQIIAYVGSTGLATGPHLHYEFHVDSIPRDALRVKLPKAKPVSIKYMPRFKEISKSLLAKLNGEATTSGIATN